MLLLIEVNIKATVTANQILSKFYSFYNVTYQQMGEVVVESQSLDQVEGWKIAWYRKDWPHTLGHYKEKEESLQ